MALIKETIEVEEFKDKKKFLVKRYMEDELTPQQLVENHKQVEEAIKGLKERLASLDDEKKKLKIVMEEQLKELTPRLEGLSKGINRAKALVELDKKKEERSGEKKPDISK